MAADSCDEVTHPMRDEPTESTSREYAASVIQGLVSPYGIAIMFTVATTVTTWRRLGDLLPGRLAAVVVIAWSLAVGAGVFAVCGSNSLRGPTTDREHR